MRATALPSARAMGPEAEERVVSHLPLVGHVVAEMASRLPTHVAREDLASAGRLALTQASAAFDASRGVPFAAYARTRIRGAILDELRSVDWASRGVRARSRARETAVEGLLTRLGRTPTQEEVAAELGTSTDDVASLDTDLHRSVVLSLQGFGDGVDVEGFVATRVAGPEQVLLHRERTAYLIAAVQELPDRLRTIVVGWFFEDRPMAEIAVELGVSESRERARTVTEAFGDIDRSLSALSGAYDVQLRATVEETNAAAAGVAELNGAIRKGTQSGMPVNELMDRRDLLVGRLADLAGVSTRAGADGMVDVYLGSLSLVRADEAVKAAVSPASGQAVELVWDRGPGTPSQVVELSEGTARGMLDAVATVLPGYRNQLDTVAAALTEQVNTVHGEGYDLDGTAGARLFDTDPPGGAVTAASIRVGFTDPRAVAAASLPPSAGTASLDNGNATALAALGSPTRAASPDAAYRNVVVSLGVESQTAMRRVQVQASILGGINAAQESQAGVDIDEEMVNLLTYQRAYEGAARVMSAVDAALDTLINRTGMVGR